MWNRSTRRGAACVTVLASNVVNCLVTPASALGGGAAVRGSSIPQNTDAAARARRRMTAAPIVSLELEGISVAPVIRPSHFQARKGT
jgi:hypothetical protein